MVSPRTTKANKDIYIVAIDGPAGAGKSTVAKRLAKILGVAYLDTGAMYRSLTLKALRKGIDLEDEDRLVELARNTKIELENTSRVVKVILDGEDVSQDIRSIEVTNKTFYVARTSRIREIMVEWQRAIGRKKSLVAEGRDIGTVVFPQACYKFYLDAELKERSDRRYKELKEQGKDVDARKLLLELKERDNKDMTRTTGPLKKADDAYFLDTTPLTVDQTVEAILQYIKAHG